MHSTLSGSSSAGKTVAPFFYDVNVLNNLGSPLPDFSTQSLKAPINGSETCSLQELYRELSELRSSLVQACDRYITDTSHITSSHHFLLEGKHKEALDSFPSIPYHHSSLLFDPPKFSETLSTTEQWYESNRTDAAVGCCPRDFEAKVENSEQIEKWSNMDDNRKGTKALDTGNIDTWSAFRKSAPGKSTDVLWSDIIIQEHARLQMCVHHTENAHVPSGKAVSDSSADRKHQLEGATTTPSMQYHFSMPSKMATPSRVKVLTPQSPLLPVGTYHSPPKNRSTRRSKEKSNQVQSHGSKDVIQSQHGATSLLARSDSILRTHTQTPVHEGEESRSSSSRKTRAPPLPPHEEQISAHRTHPSHDSASSTSSSSSFATQPIDTPSNSRQHSNTEPQTDLRRKAKTFIMDILWHRSSNKVSTPSSGGKKRVPMRLEGNSSAPAHSMSIREKEPSEEAASNLTQTSGTSSSESSSTSPRVREQTELSRSKRNQKGHSALLRKSLMSFNLAFKRGFGSIQKQTSRVQDLVRSLQLSIREKRPRQENSTPSTPTSCEIREQSPCEFIPRIESACRISHLIQEELMNQPIQDQENWPYAFLGINGEAATTAVLNNFIRDTILSDEREDVCKHALTSNQSILGQAILKLVTTMGGVNGFLPIEVGKRLLAPITPEEKKSGKSMQHIFSERISRTDFLEEWRKDFLKLIVNHLRETLSCPPRRSKIDVVLNTYVQAITAQWSARKRQKYRSHFLFFLRSLLNLGIHKAL